MEALLGKLRIELGAILRNGIPDGFNHLTLSLDGRKKPIRLHHSKRIVDFFDQEETGIVLAYSAGPDNVHDKAVFHALNNSGLFRSYRQRLYGLRGTTFQRYFKPELSVIMQELALVLACLDGIVNWAECGIHVSMSGSDRTAGNSENKTD
jgi:hypothetical protein